MKGRKKRSYKQAPPVPLAVTVGDYSGRRFADSQETNLPLFLDGNLKHRANYILKSVIHMNKLKKKFKLNI